MSEMLKIGQNHNDKSRIFLLEALSREFSLKKGTHQSLQSRKGKIMSFIAVGQWYRTCQECGHEQAAKEPAQNKELTDSYRSAKCRVCKSEALDYGTHKTDPNYDYTKD
jgi:hypothetical protein